MHPLSLETETLPQGTFQLSSKRIVQAIPDCQIPNQRGRDSIKYQGHPPFRRGRYRQKGCRSDYRLEVCAKAGMSCHRVRDVGDDRLGMTSSTCVKRFSIVLLASGKCLENNSRRAQSRIGAGTSWNSGKGYRIEATGILWNYLPGKYDVYQALKRNEQPFCWRGDKMRPNTRGYS